ncbi:AAA domain-containing protein [Candidatus Dojkabacteria bacterium]|nr:AAA domain-containing protein [Candidatus Dojkabacteria bacterium]
MGYAHTVDQMKELDKFSEYAKKAIVNAFEQAMKEEASEVTPKHIFIGILEDDKGICPRLLNKLGVDVNRTLKSLDFIKEDKDTSQSKNLKMNETSKQLLVDAFVIASEMNHVYVGTEHILLSILKLEDLDFVKDLNKVGIDYASVSKVLLGFATYHKGVFKKSEDDMDEDEDGDDSTSSISTFAHDMNELAESGKYMPIYGREIEIERMIHILSRKTKSNPILVGEAGVGKTAIVEGLVQKIVNNKVPPSFSKKRIVNLDLAGIIAGSKIRGDVEERILGIMKEAKQDPNLILFIDEIHMIVGAGSTGQGTMDVANILKPFLTTNDISVIGATTLDEYQKYFESDSALTRRFQSIIVEEIGEEDSIQALKNIRTKLENFHGVKIEDNALVQSVKLTKRYITDRFLPDKAIDVLDEAAAGKKISKEGEIDKFTEIKEEYEDIRKSKDKVLLQGKIKKAAKLRKQEIEIKKKMDKMTKKTNSRNKSLKVTDDDIRKVIADLTKIPVEKMDSNEIQSLINIEQSLRKSIVGQPDAINKVAAAIKRSRVGIGDQNRPSGSFLFLGPSGVGKTELAKTIAKEVFGDESSLVQIDMSEHMEKHSVSKLIGSPPGYVGFQEGGQLTEKIRRNPYSVVLFDEIEKAHIDLLNILLQILEEGQLQDAKGRTINFRNTIIIMTSNIGAEEVMKDNILGFNLDLDTSNDSEEEEGEMDEAFNLMRERLMEKLKDTLRPELLNRIDEIIVFRGLSDSDITDIIGLELEKLNKRLAEKNVHVEASRGAIKFIAKEGASKEYGARNVKRKIQELIENPLALLILKEGKNFGEEKQEEPLYTAKVTKARGKKDLNIKLNKKK